MGDGDRTSRLFASNDGNSGYSKDFLGQVNYIDSNSPDYIASTNNAWSRTTVNVGKADRGKEA